MLVYTGETCSSKYFELHNKIYYSKLQKNIYLTLKNVLICVWHIIDYASSVWGFKKFQAIYIDNYYIQNRKIRYYIGVHRFTSLLAIQGDPSQYRRGINMIRFWNKVFSFDPDHYKQTYSTWIITYAFKNNRIGACSEINEIHCTSKLRFLSLF